MQKFHVRENYPQHMQGGEWILLKVQQSIIARKLSKGSVFVPNESWLNPDICTKESYGPAVEVIGPCLNGFIFEQEYHVRNDRVPIYRDLNYHMRI